MDGVMENGRIQLIPTDVSLAGQVAAYYQRNRGFLEAFEPAREEQFFSLAHQTALLEQEADIWRAKTSRRFYIRPAGEPQQVIGAIGLNNIVWGAFCSAFLGYKLDRDFINRGYMSEAIGMVVQYAFQELHLHRIEANVMPRNKASLRALEKNQFISEGVSRAYLRINGRWEDHVHMVRLNDNM